MPIKLYSDKSRPVRLKCSEKLARWLGAIPAVSVPHNASGTFMLVTPTNGSGMYLWPLDQKAFER